MDSNIPREDQIDAQQWAMEDAAADEEAELCYREMEDHDQYMAEQEANSRAAEEAYRRMEEEGTPTIETDLF